MKIPATIEGCVKWINEAVTPEQRAARKVLCFPVLYGSPQKLGDLLKPKHKPKADHG